MDVNKLRVRVISVGMKDQYKFGDEGFVDGYIGGEDRPCAIVVIGGRLTVISIHRLAII